MENQKRLIELEQRVRELENKLVQREAQSAANTQPRDPRKVQRQ